MSLRGKTPCPLFSREVDIHQANLLKYALTQVTNDDGGIMNLMIIFFCFKACTTPQPDERDEQCRERGYLADAHNFGGTSTYLKLTKSTKTA